MHTARFLCSYEFVEFRDALHSEFIATFFLFLEVHTSPIVDNHIGYHLPRLAKLLRAPDMCTVSFSFTIVYFEQNVDNKAQTAVSV